MITNVFHWTIRGVAWLSIGVPAALLYCAIHAPWTPAVAAGDETNGDLERIRTNLARAHDELLKTEEALIKSRARAELVRQRIPDVPGEDEFLRQLTEIADATGLRIRGYDPGTRAVKESFSQIHIDLSCSADYPALCAFLDQLKHVPRIFTVERMTINASPKGEECPVDLNLLVYFRQQPTSEAGRKPAKNG